MKDYSIYPIDTDVFFSGAEDKAQITINGRRYIMKYQRNSEIGMTFSHVSEYLGSHMFEILGIPVHDTFLGTYNGRNILSFISSSESKTALIRWSVLSFGYIQEPLSYTGAILYVLSFFKKPQFPPCLSKFPLKASTINISQNLSTVSRTSVDFLFSINILWISSYEY